MRSNIFGSRGFFTRCKASIGGIAVLVAATVSPVWAGAVVTSPEPVEAAAFGNAVDSTEAWLVVGERNAPNGEGEPRGTVYIYDKSESTTVPIQIIDAPPQAHGFGTSISISGDLMVVGTPQANGQPGTPLTPGTAYVYEWNGTTWNETGSVDAPYGEANQAFGFAVSTDGNRIAVGAISGGPDGRGAVYTLSKEAGEWDIEEEISPSTLGFNSLFGRSVCLQGTTLAVGAPFEAFYSGAIYIFEDDGSSWTTTQVLTGTSFNMLGQCVALAGTRLAASGGNKVRTWKKRTSGWVAKQTITPTSSTTGFGISLDLRGRYLLVGQVMNEWGSQGRATLYKERRGNWRAQGSFAPSSPASPSGYGISVSLDGSDLVIGEPHADLPGTPNAGRVRVIER